MDMRTRLAESRKSTGCQCLFECPAARKPRSQSCVIHAVLSSPIFQALRSSAQRHKSCAPCVSLLLSGTCPSAILWRIRAIVIDAVDFVLSSWRLPHVGQKRHEAILSRPSFTDRYSASAIICIALSVGVGASRQHPVPEFVYAGPGHPVPKFDCSSVASTAYGSTANELRGEDRLFCSAIASAEPCGVRLFPADSRSGERDHEQFSKSRSGKIVEVPCVNGRMWASHCSFSRKERWSGPHGSYRSRCGPLLFIAHRGSQFNTQGVLCG